MANKIATECHKYYIESIFGLSLFTVCFPNVIFKDGVHGHKYNIKPIFGLSCSRSLSNYDLYSRRRTWSKK